MTRNFLLVIEYDGSDFHGWQTQKGYPTIQGELEKVLQTMSRQNVIVNGSGRTDAGVHAMAQVASFQCDTNITAEAFRLGLNSLLPDGIIIHACREVDPNFHARFNVKNKTYRYNILNRDLPVAIGRQYAWYIRKKLDIEAMDAAARHLSGTHDFVTFEATGSPRSHTVRTVSQTAWDRKNQDYLTFEITANGFLRYMVRKIVGTLVHVGLGRISPDGFYEILHSQDRSRSRETAPPHGLFLMKVMY